MLLEVKQVFAGYGPIEILHGISLQAHESRITAVIGPNGAGKSTLLKTIYGLVKAQKGEVWLNHKNITNHHTENLLRSGMAYVEQGRSIFPRMTVMENLLLGVYVEKDSKRSKQAVEDVFDRFPVLAERRKQLASWLSGGEQRMLELGRAFMFRPNLILLDEPSLGLAPALIDELYATVLRFASTEQVAFLIVEQNVSKALEVAHYCYVLDLGQNVFEGTPAELMSDGRIVGLYVGR